MSKFGFTSGAAYTASSLAIAAEECINFYPETNESQSAMTQQAPYGGRSFPQSINLIYTPGLSVFATLGTSPVRGQIYTGSRYFAVGGGQFYEVGSLGSPTSRGTVASDPNPVSLAFNGLQVLCVSAGHAYCFTLATNTFTEVTGSLAGTPVKCEYSDGYFIAQLSGNKYQMSQLLDGTTWPGQLVNAVSVFADNIQSIICNHRELWALGQTRSQPFQDTGSAEVFDPISGALLETGCVSTFAPARLDNSVFWVAQDERGATICFRSNGYTPQRVSTHAVELALASYTNLGSLASYSYQENGHLFWVLYIPGAPCNWVYDVSTGLWHKRAFWNGSSWEAHHGWNYAYAFGKHLVGDWNSGNIYQMSSANLQDYGNNILRVRQAPHIIDEMQWQYHDELTIDIDAGLSWAGPGAPQAMLQWSDDRGHTWSNQSAVSVGVGAPGDTFARAVWRRLGRTRHRLYQLSVSDPYPWYIVDSYLKTRGAA